MPIERPSFSWKKTGFFFSLGEKHLGLSFVADKQDEVVPIAATA